MNNYLLLDNNPTIQSESIVRRINASSSRVNIVPMEMLPWEQQIPALINELAQIDGILLDWRLYEPDERSAISYSAEALAQHFRFLFNTGQITKDVPIILCSANRKFKSSYNRDFSGHDLFVTVYNKADFAEKAEEVADELAAIAEGFKAVQRNPKSTVQTLLSPPPDLYLDSRLEGELQELIRKGIPHNLIRFLLEEIIHRPGVLINEYTLAARLGVDKEKSDTWTSFVKEQLSPAFEYKGILSDGWQLWWADGFIEWWKAKISPKHPQYFGAKERVRLLCEQTGKNGLIVAEKLPFCASDEFWAICEATRRPIDVADGLRIQVENIRPWQAEQYVTLYSILERINSFKLNPIEKERIKYLKNLAKQNGEN